MRNLYTDSITITNVSPFRHYSSNSFNGGQRPTYPNPSSCCCCCCCCCSCNRVSSIPIRTASSSRLVALNSTPFYGFSQSALIKKGASRMRMVVGSGEYYRNSLCIRDLGFDWIEQRSGLRQLGAACDDAENIISLLNEKVKRLKSREELKARRRDKYHGGEYHTVKMQCSYGVGDNRAREIAESRKKYEHLRGRIGFVDGKSSTYVRKDSDSEEFVGSGGRRDHINQSVQFESRVSKVYNSSNDAETIISLLNEESSDESVSYDDVRMKKVTKKGNFKRSEKYHGGDYDTVKMQCSSRVAESRKKYEHLRERIGFVDGKSTIYSRKDGDSEEFVGSESGRRDHLSQSVQSESRISKLYNSSDMQRSRNHLKVNRASNKYEHLTGSSSFVDEKSSRYMSKVSDSEECAGSGSERRDHLGQSVQSESCVSNSHKDTSLKMQYDSDMRSSRNNLKDNRGSNKYEHLTGSSGVVDGKSSRYLSKVSGSKEHVISAGETSDSSYKYKYITDSSGYLSRRNDNEDRVFSAGGLCSSCGKVTSESEARTTNEQRSQVYAETKVASRPKASSSSIADEAHEQRKQEQFVASSQLNLMKSEDYTERADVAESYEENNKISRLRSELSETRLTSTVGQQSELVVDEKSHQENLVAGSQGELIKENQEYTELVDFDGSSVNVLEEKVASVSTQTAKEELFQTGQKLSSKAQSGSSQVYIGGTMIEETSSASEEMLHYSQTYLTERVKETHEHVKERIKQTELRYEVETPLKVPSFGTSTSQVRIEEVGEDQDKRNMPSVPSPRLDRPSQSIEVTHEHTSQQTTEKVQSESHVGNSYMDTSLKLPYNFGVGESVTTVISSDSSDKYEHLTGIVSYVDEKSSRYLSKVSGSAEHVISVGETSDSSYRYDHTTDSSGLNKGSDSLVSSSLTVNEACEQHNQEHFVASSQVNLMKSEDYTEREDVAEGNEENTNISRLRSELSETRVTSTVGEQFELVVGEKSRQERLVASSQTELMRVNLECPELVYSGESNVKVLEENMGSVSSQSDEEELFKTGQKQPLRNQSGISQVHFDGTMIKDSSSASEEALQYEQSYLTERVKETREHVKETITQTELRYEVQMPLKEPSFVTSTSQVRIEEMGEVEDTRKTPSVTSPRLDQPSQSIEVKPEHASQSGIVKRSGRALWNVLTYGVLNTADNVSGETNIELNADKMSSQATVSTDGLQSDSFYELLESGKEATGIMDKSEDDKEMIIASSTDSVDSADSNVNVLKENVVSVSSQTAKEDLYQTGRKKSFKAQSGSSQVHFDGTRIEGSSSSSEETLRYEQIYLSGRVTETREHEQVKETINKTELGYEVQTPLNEPIFIKKRSRLPFGTSSSQIRIEEIDEDQDKTNISPVPSPRLGPLHQSVEVTHEQPSQSGVVKRSGKALWNALAFGVLNTDDKVFEETSIELNADNMSSQATVSTDHLQSGSIYKLQESGKETTRSGSIVGKTKDDKDTSVNVASSSEETAAELKRGALLRSNQVMKERFDEWEEAYRLNTEQREIDQTFMREALEEAKKAADMWEVPVGAVLVQDGKIIARGHNLVEESRDSTAHAEMVCIRAASTMLKTWRLSGTTLYVTLEPCAMCAGAILQSRIATLVYGAPNKLLGADGSWVRLFPTSVNEEEGSAKTEGPVHPFHPNMKIRRGILETECGELMQQSFKLRRSDKGKKIEQKSDKKLHINPSKLLNKMNHKLHFLFHL